jgi:hypothetical protein
VGLQAAVSRSAGLLRGIIIIIIIVVIMVMKAQNGLQNVNVQ